MVDCVDKETRSRMMAGIGSRNTVPERVVRSALHRLGFRYRLNDKRLPGTPDLVFPRYRAVIMVHGCFWHGHDCPLFRLPATRTAFWAAKIEGNRTRDQNVQQRLVAAGWRVLTIWECALKGRLRQDPGYLARQVSRWLRDDLPCHAIRGEQG
ncbi:DNA mismatch endonuclease Vsr [Haematospirillum sp. H1815]|nr:DNA mismatch endonuclease Vsr [Haematospirillum sp. H1815]